ncbi:MAG: hypothetical protein QXU32_10430 [Nitrososphaerales archaeon]
MKDIELAIDQKKSVVGADITGTVTINYNGRFDGIQVNTYITGSNDQVLFTNIDDRKIAQLARLYVERNTIGDKRAFRFTARVDQSAQKDANIRFRAAIIQEHKEVASDTMFVSLHAD